MNDWRKGVFLTLAWVAVAWADQPPLKIDDLGPEGPSSFAHLVKVTFMNEKYVYVDLANVLGSADLWVDGKSFHLGSSLELGLPIPPLGTKSGCVSLEDYVPPLPPGKHRIQMKTNSAFGSLESNTLKLAWSGPHKPPANDFKTRKHEVDEIVKKLNSDTSRACVELWFSRRDGGVQSPGRVRYYVNPEIKVEVTYDESGGYGGPENLVKGHVKVYREARILD